MSSVGKCRALVPTVRQANRNKKEHLLMPSMADMMKQAQQLQNKLARVQEEAGKKTVEASSGGNMVNAGLNGRLELISLRIDPTVVEGGDVEMLQDLVLAAVNEG